MEKLRNRLFVLLTILLVPSCGGGIPGLIAESLQAENLALRTDAQSSVHQDSLDPVFQAKVAEIFSKSLEEGKVVATVEADEPKSDFGTEPRFKETVLRIRYEVKVVATADLNEDHPEVSKALSAIKAQAVFQD